MQHFGGLHGSPGTNSKKVLNNGSFHACPGLKGPLSPDEVIYQHIDEKK